MLSIAHLSEKKRQSQLRDCEITLRNRIEHISLHRDFFKSRPDLVMHELRAHTDLLLHLINTHKSRGGFDK